jgi:hypothetical protein
MTRTRMMLARLLLVVPLLAAGLALGSPRLASAARVCANEVITGTVKDNIVVAAGTQCTICGAVVRGGVTVEPGGELTASGAEIRGSVSAEGATVVTLSGGVVRGGVTVTGMLAGFPSLQVIEVEVRGDLVVSGNTGTYIQLYGNTVRGSLVIRDNRESPFFWVATNVVDVNLDCSDNDPVQALLGFPANTAGGAKLGQCENL